MKISACVARILFFTSCAAAAWGQAVSTDQTAGAARDASGLPVSRVDVKATQTGNATMVFPAAAQDSDLSITWIGQSCFLIQTRGGAAVLTDPPAPPIGYALPAVSPDAVTITHTLPACRELSLSSMAAPPRRARR